MSNYNTGNPVPSSDPRDLDDNSKVLDSLVTGSALQTPDRLGGMRLSLAGMEQRVDDFTSANVSALAGLTGAADRGFYFTGSGAMSLYTLSALGRTLGGIANDVAGRAALSAAKSGANGDITSITGLATPLSVAQGGTGTNTSTGTGAGVHAASPTITTPNVVGTNTNNNAAAGSVGEFVSSQVLSGSAVALANATAANVTSISLTAGDWDVYGVVQSAPAGTTTMTQLVGAVTTTSATFTLPGSPGRFSHPYSTAAGVAPGGATGPTRLSLGATTTVYLVAQATFAVSTCAAYGFIGARRIR